MIGDTDSPDTTLGPLNSSRQRERVAGFIDRKASVRLVTGGVAPDRPGSYLEPAVVAGLQRFDELIQREILRAGDKNPAIRR